MTDDGTYDYTYDCENRLIEIENNSTTIAQFRYDFAGRRIEKVADGTTTTYCYDGDQVIAEYEDGTLKRKFIYGPGIDEPIAMIVVDGQNETWYWYFYDRLGNVVALSDSAGNIDAE